MQVLSFHMPFSKTESAGYLANHMARLFASKLQRRIHPLGLAPAQFMVLLILWDEDGLTQSELTQRLDVEQATMANTLRRMERDGLITRKPSQKDGRARLIFLTESTKVLQKPAKAAAMAQNQAALAGLSEAEQATLVDLMQRVIAAMQRG